MDKFDTFKQLKIKVELLMINYQLSKKKKEKTW